MAEPCLQSSPATRATSTSEKPDDITAPSTGPIIRFSADKIPNVAGDVMELVVRGFYSDTEWQMLDSYERAVIVTKGVQFRNQNKPNRPSNDDIDMVQPNPFADLDEDGLEVWPEPADDVKLEDSDKEEFHSILTKAMHHRFAQRQWGDKLYHGRFQMSKTCIGCTHLQVECVRRSTGVTCESCHEQRPAIVRCQHLERYYIDYASRKLNIGLAETMALFRQYGGPPGPKGSSHQSSSTLRGTPSSTRGRGRGRGRRRGAFGGRATAIPLTPYTPRRTILLGPAEGNAGSVNASNAPAAPTAASPSPTPSIVEIEPFVPGASESPIRDIKRRRLSAKSRIPSLVSTIANESRERRDLSEDPEQTRIASSLASIQALEKDLEACHSDKRSLQTQYDALRKLSHHFLQEVSDSQTLLEICMSSVMECFDSNQAPEAVKTLVEQKDRLRAACLEHRKGVWALEGETRSNGS